MEVGITMIKKNENAAAVASEQHGKLMGNPFDIKLSDAAKKLANNCTVQVKQFFLHPLKNSFMTEEGSEGIKMSPSIGFRRSRGY